jgi:hypothetical protein
MTRNPKLVTLVQWLMGSDYLINGVNWWFKMITPYPSVSDFLHSPPPPDFIGGMIQTGFMFHIVKATEIACGLALLTNRFVPLMLIVAFPVTVSVFLADVFLIKTLRGFIMGGGAFLMHSFLLFAYINHYRPLLRARGEAQLALGSATTVGIASGSLASRLPLYIYGTLAALAGTAMVSWVAVMIVQYIRSPAPLRFPARAPQSCAPSCDPPHPPP